MEKKYYSIESMLTLIDRDNQLKCIKILKENEDLFKKAPGSKTKHQAWPGGFLSHTEEVMNIGIILYNTFHQIRPLPFKLSEMMLVLFIHDLEKPWKYSSLNYEIDTKEDREKFRELKLKEYGIELTPEMKIALKYIEGENENYSTNGRVMNEMGALCHMADIASARLWFNEPQKRNSW